MKRQVMKTSIIAICFFCIVYSLNIPLSKSRQNCIVIPQGSYEFQYVVSGHNQKEVRCVIQETNRVIYEVTGRSQFQAEFQVVQNDASICFSSLDTMAKSVSFDFFKTDDPLKGLIHDKEKLKIHEKLYKSFQELEKVYRDQHFFLQRNYIHSILLRQTEIVVIFFLLLKLIIAFICSFFQLYFVKRILEQNFVPIPSQQSK